jgi:hypothetical protein
VRAAAALAWRLLRTSGRRDATTVALGVVAFAVTTALLLFVLAGLHGFGQRAEREAYRAPSAATQSEAVAVLARHTEQLAGRPLTVLDVAMIRENTAPPPGLPRPPRPGELWVSPALARLLESGDPVLPHLAEPGADVARLTGRIDERGLLHHDELLAVVGRDAADQGMRPGASFEGVDPPRFVATLDGPAGGGPVATTSSVYVLLAQVAAVLLVVPLLSLGGAAARLGVARRDHRLATLRLLGATRRQILTVSVVEALLAGVAGAVLGVIAYAAFLIPLGSRLSFQAGRFTAGELWLGVGPTLAVIGGVTVLAALSAVLGLRRLVISPLGVARRQNPPGMRLLRLLALVVVVVAWGVAGGSTAALGVGVVLVLLAVVFGVLNVVGPWLVAVAGRVAARTARGPEQLLAGRRLVADPKGAWRSVAGLTLAGFVAAVVSAAPVLSAGMDQADVEGRVFARDLLTGALLTLGIVFAVAAASAGTAQVAAVLDRQRTLAQLVLAGTPVSVLQRARRREALIPLVLTLALSVGLGLFFLVPLAGVAFVADLRGLLALAACLAAGTGLVLAATAGSGRLLRTVVCDVHPEPD